MWNCRRCRLGVVVAARQRCFQTVASRFVAGCRPFLMRAIRPFSKKNINTKTPKYFLSVEMTLKYITIQNNYLSKMYASKNRNESRVEG